VKSTVVVASRVLSAKSSTYADIRIDRWLRIARAHPGPGRRSLRVDLRTGRWQAADTDVKPQADRLVPAVPEPRRSAPSISLTTPNHSWTGSSTPAIRPSWTARPTDPAGDPGAPTRHHQPRTGRTRQAGPTRGITWRQPGEIFV